MKTTTYQRSYIVRVARTWNVLADDLNSSMDSLAVFKSFLLKYYFNALNTTFNIRNLLKLYAVNVILLLASIIR